MAQANILTSNNTLIVFSTAGVPQLFRDFFGTVLEHTELEAGKQSFASQSLYLSGDLSLARPWLTEFSAALRIFVVKQLSSNYQDESSEVSWEVIDQGQVPLSVQGVGVYFPRFFCEQEETFEQICSEHTFQDLTQSTRPAKAHRKGIYLSPVTQSGDKRHFHLLRCSTNLSGPTENFQASDWQIVNALNREANELFSRPAPLNHVLAQIYLNTKASVEQKQAKAKIKAHADKTKDMPENGIMAFCTFYRDLEKLNRLPDRCYDYGYKQTSGLTRLDFKLKGTVSEVEGQQLPGQFSITLYPGSVFFMPLFTNQFYTHEIRPSALDAQRLPTRLGYVVRCSSTAAFHQQGQTYLKTGAGWTTLEEATDAGMAELRKLYADENKSHAPVDYGQRFLFSMNQGDYRSPVYQMEDEFRRYQLSSRESLFEELLESATFEQLGKGRMGTVLVLPDSSRGVPLVRTTTKYGQAAQIFQKIHHRLTQQIQERAALSTSFNNALFESYSNEYFKMGFHSDQALDLEDESYVALYSCYQYPDRQPPRSLIVEAKQGQESCEIPLLHDSVVLFSTDTNRRFRHKIVLDKSSPRPENLWLGLTLRTAKTFVRYQGARALLEDGTALELLESDREREFYGLRGRENRETDFVYPQLNYTLSPSDLLPPMNQQ